LGRNLRFRNLIMPDSLQLPSTPPDFPRRIVCLTDETVEVLYLLGEQDRIVGVSGYTTRPPEARKKPHISAFRNANIQSILDLKPDLVLTFSDVQAEIARNLILRGATILNFNQRSIAEIFDMIGVLSRLVDKPDEGRALIGKLKRGLDAVAASAAKFPYRPRVFFEEWKDPLISGIQWTEELVELAGGTPTFPELIRNGKAQDRVVDPAEVVKRNPEVILASWCGMKVNKPFIASRPAWSNITAVRNGHIYEIKSAYILQPGPASLTEGVRQLHAILARVVGVDVPPELMPTHKLDPDLL
jgi:iron complex transport system substrate-binding protein